MENIAPTKCRICGENWKTKKKNEGWRTTLSCVGMLGAFTRSHSMRTWIVPGTPEITPMCIGDIAASSALSPTKDKTRGS